METETAFVILTLLSMFFVLAAYKMGKMWLIASTSVLLLLANIVGPKVVSVFGFAITAGTPIFAGLPIVTDLITERYGKSEARRAVFIAFFAMLFFAAISFFVVQMQVLPFAQMSGDAVDFIFSTSVRLMIASPIAYLIWQMIDIWVYHVILKRTDGRHLWLRNNASTVIAQAGSTVTFFFLGFVGTGAPWLEIAAVTIVFYWVIALIDTGIVYASKSVVPLDMKQ